MTPTLSYSCHQSESIGHSIRVLEQKSESCPESQHRRDASFTTNTEGDLQVPSDSSQGVKQQGCFIWCQQTQIALSSSVVSPTHTVTHQFGNLNRSNKHVEGYDSCDVQLSGKAFDIGACGLMSDYLIAIHYSVKAADWLETRRYI